MVRSSLEQNNLSALNYYEFCTTHKDPGDQLLTKWRQTVIEMSTCSRRRLNRIDFKAVLTPTLIKISRVDAKWGSMLDVRSP